LQILFRLQLRKTTLLPDAGERWIGRSRPFAYLYLYLTWSWIGTGS